MVGDWEVRNRKTAINEPGLGADLRPQKFTWIATVPAAVFAEAERQRGIDNEASTLRCRTAVLSADPW